MVTLYSSEPRGESANYPDDKAALFWDRTAHPRRGRAYKWWPKRSLSQSILSVHCSWLDIYFCNWITNTQSKSLTCKNTGHINKCSTLCVIAWNFRTYMDNKSSNRPECHKTIVAPRALKIQYGYHNTQWNTLCWHWSTHWGQCQLQILLEWEGQEWIQRSGSKFHHSDYAVQAPRSASEGINQNFTVMRVQLKSKTNLTFINVYTPTMAHTNEEKELFYQELRKLVHSMSNEDKFLFLGDFNAHVSLDVQSWPTIIEKHGLAKLMWMVNYSFISVQKMI